MPGAPGELVRGGRSGTLSARRDNRRSGDRGEEIALRYLGRRGYRLVERNYRTRYGEVDLILRQGSALVFVEVKLRRGTGFGEPVEAVTVRKQQRIRRLAEHYLAEKEPDFEEVRFDVVGVLAGTGEPEVRHVPHAF